MSDIIDFINKRYPKTQYHGYCRLSVAQGVGSSAGERFELLLKTDRIRGSFKAFMAVQWKRIAREEAAYKNIPGPQIAMSLPEIEAAKCDLRLLESILQEDSK